MVMRAAWGPLFSWGARTGQTFTTVFTRGRVMGLSTYRRAVMLGDWRIANARGVSRSMFESLSHRDIVPRAWMGEAHEGQRQTYRYSVELRGYNKTTRVEVFRTASVESRTQLTKQQVEERAWAQWGETYEGAPEYFEDVTLWGGRVK